MKSEKIRLKTNCRILPGPGIHFSLAAGGALEIGNKGAGNIWAHMLTMDQENQYPVPLAHDGQGPYYLAHWPACVAFCYGKIGPIKKFLLQGGGTERWLPVPRLQARPVIYALMDTIAKSPASRDSKADPRAPYDISKMGASVITQKKFCTTIKALLADDDLAGPLHQSLWEGRNLLEHALQVRLFDVAEVLWENGLRFGRGNLDDGLLFKDMANPCIALDLGIGVSCAIKNIFIPRNRDDGDDAQTLRAERYCVLVEKWMDRFAQEGGAWPKNSQSFSWISGDTKKTLQGNLVCIPLAMRPDIITVDGQTPEGWPEWIKEKWRLVWSRAALEHGPAEMMNSSVHAQAGSFSDEMSLGAWLRQNAHEILAAKLEQKALQASTESDSHHPIKKMARF